MIHNVGGYIVTDLQIAFGLEALLLFMMAAVMAARAWWRARPARSERWNE